MDEESPELLRAEDLFHDAMDAYTGHRIGHGREGQWVDDNSMAVVEALLQAGWKPPED